MCRATNAQRSVLPPQGGQVKRSLIHTRVRGVDFVYLKLGCAGMPKWLLRQVGNEISSKASAWACKASQRAARIAICSDMPEPSSDDAVWGLRSMNPDLTRAGTAIRSPRLASERGAKPVESARSKAIRSARPKLYLPGGKCVVDLISRDPSSMI